MAKSEILYDEEQADLLTDRYLDEENYQEVEEKPWSDEDEASFEEWEEERRQRLAEANEY